MVLHRGRDNPSVFAALEACALLGGLQVLLPFQEAVLGGLHRSIAALEAAIASTTAAEPAGKGVVLVERWFMLSFLRHRPHVLACCRRTFAQARGPDSRGGQGGGCSVLACGRAVAADGRRRMGGHAAPAEVRA